MRTALSKTATWSSVALLACLVGCSSVGPGGQDQAQAPAGATSTSAGDGTVVGTAGDRTFTLADVDARVDEYNFAAFRALHDARQGALDALINEHLLEQEAAARGMIAEELEKSEITARITPVTDAEITAFYEDRKAQMGGRQLDDMLKGQISAYLAAQQEFEARRAFYDSLRAKTTVKQSLTPPVMQVAANDPFKGPADAPVTIVEFSDFQ